MVKYKKIGDLRGLRFSSLQASLDVEFKKGFFNDRWRFSKKAKGLIVFAIIAVMLISVFAFLPKQGSSIIPQNTAPPISPSPSPSSTASVTRTNYSMPQIVPLLPALTPSPTPKPPGLIESAQTVNSTVWRGVANYAWNYFQPDVGVDPGTGLPYASGIDFMAFTDWDLGVYIQAVIDAQKIGLVGPGGDWGSNARFDKVLTFLETRELNNASYPYQFYNSTDGGNYHLLSDVSNSSYDVVDTGRLFVALNNLRNFNTNFTTRINNFVYNTNGNRSNYAALVPSIAQDANSNSIYSYYFDSGFASFWPKQLGNLPATIMNNISKSPTVLTYGNISLPKAAISCDPLLCSVFELNNTNSKLMALANQVYLAHEAYYNSTNNYVAFSEGPAGATGFIWEWVVSPNGDAWKIQNQDNLGSSGYLNIDPVFYTKVAFSFLALYNTTFAHNMVVCLEHYLETPTNGYEDGMDNKYNLFESVGSNTNGLILDAAQYAIQNYP